ncbi:hypothetical protein PC116_g2121 [Phytophthora cactorum]|nr:hypothetical protein PC116_g2121 [Phytophthora cactorum]
MARSTSRQVEEFAYELELCGEALSENREMGNDERMLFRISDITAQRVDPAEYSTPRLRIDTPKVSGEVLTTSEVRSDPEI